MSIKDSFDAKAELLTALESNLILLQEVIGGFHNLVASDVIPFPRVVYQEINNGDVDYRDNKASSAAVAFQISIFCDEQTVSRQTRIAKEVDKVLKAIGYSRYDSIDLYEEDTKRHHKAMRYRKNVFF